MTEKIDKRKIVSEEQLERLKLAREKAQVVKAKQAAIKKAEKEKQKKDLDDKYNALVAAKPAEQPQEATKDETPAPIAKRKTKKVIEIDSDETSSDSDSGSDSGSEYDITPVRQKYKQKYKHKYATKYKSSDHVADITTIARQNISNKVSDELKRMAFNSLFG